MFMAIKIFIRYVVLTICFPIIFLASLILLVFAPLCWAFEVDQDMTALDLIKDYLKMFKFEI